MKINALQIPLSIQSVMSNAFSRGKHDVLRLDERCLHPLYRQFIRVSGQLSDTYFLKCKMPGSHTTLIVCEPGIFYYTYDVSRSTPSIRYLESERSYFTWQTKQLLCHYRKATLHKLLLVLPLHECPEIRAGSIHLTNQQLQRCCSLIRLKYFVL